MTHPVRTAKRPVRILTVALVLAALTGTVSAQGAVEAPAVADADPVLIRLGDRQERLSDVMWRFEVAMRSFASGQGVPYTDELAARMRGLLPNYIEQRGNELVLLREADRRGLTPDEESVNETLERLRDSAPEGDYDAALAAAGFGTEERLVTLIREADLITQVVERVQSEVEPTESELRVRYVADAARYTVPETFCARHILVAEEAMASEIVERAAAGEDFAELARQHGTDGTAGRGGDLGCFTFGQMVPTFEEAVARAPVGEPTGPVQTQFGYHALLVYDHRPAEATPFSEVREDVRQAIAADIANATLGSLLRWSGLVLHPERLPSE